MTWLTDIIRWLFFLIDRIVYFLVQQVYSLFIEIVNTSLFTEDIFASFSHKVYALVGVFMLFKVSFSLLTYIVNPNEFTDSNKGFSKIITNVVTSLIMLLMVPFVFQEAMKLQTIILKDDIVARIFSSEEYNISSHDVSAGSNMALITMNTFYHENTANDDQTRVGFKSLSSLFDSDVNEKDSNGEYVMSYEFLISTVVGVALVSLLLSFCFDIAVRSVKLGFLRMFAPIPIIARIDPKKGNEVFNKWLKTCTGTYLDLFVRLIAIFFAIYIIGMLDQLTFSATTGEAVQVSLFTRVFIILGVLMFAKQMPKLIEDLTGIKMSGNFELNPMKKLAAVPLAGRPLTAATRFGVRTGANAVGGLANAARTGIKTGANKLANNPDFASSKFGSKVLAANSGLRTFGNGVHNKMDKYKEKLKGAYDTVDSLSGGSLSNVGRDFDETIGAVGRSLQDDLGLLERKDRILSNREAEILGDQAKSKEIMQRNKTMTAANDAVLERAKKKVSDSVQYATKKAEVERYKSLADNSTALVSDLQKKEISLNTRLSELNEMRAQTTNKKKLSVIDRNIEMTTSQLTTTSSELQAATENMESCYNEYAEKENKFNYWANKGGVFEYIDKTGEFKGRDNDAVLEELVSKRDVTARDLSDSSHDYVSQFVGVSAKTTDDNSGLLKGENTKIEASFVHQEQELYDIKERKRQNAESRRSVGDYRRFGPPGGGKK